jgi:hypothetical protein
MSDELLIKCGSPTLAGLKTGNMFSYTYESREEVRRDLRRLNKILVPRGLRVIPLRYSDKTVLIYLYRIEALKADLSQKEAVRILREVGYESADSDQCVVKLIRKLRGAKEFKERNQRKEEKNEQSSSSVLERNRQYRDNGECGS